MKTFVKEFKEFAVKGNVIDLAVAVVIGGAFGKIVSSLVANIITPLMGIILGGVDMSGLELVVGEASVTYGVFLQSILDFLIIALVIFLVIKAINSINKKKKKEEEEEKKPEKPKEPSEEVLLLREIRDSLRKK